MKLDDWIPLPEVQAIVKHGIAALTVAVVFWLVGVAVKHLHGGWLLGFWEEFDRLVMAGLVLWFTVQLGVILWRRREWKGGPSVFVLA